MRPLQLPHPQPLVGELAKLWGDSEKEGKYYPSVHITCQISIDGREGEDLAWTLRFEIWNQTFAGSMLAALTAALAWLCHDDTLLAVCWEGDKFRMGGRRRSDEQLSGGLRLSRSAGDKLSPNTIGLSQLHGDDGPSWQLKPESAKVLLGKPSCCYARKVGLIEAKYCCFRGTILLPATRGLWDCFKSTVLISRVTWSFIVFL